MSNGGWNQQEETMLADFLVTQIRCKTSGHSEPECVRNYPRDVYFIGNLRPYHDEPPDTALQHGHLRELLAKLSPVAFGAEFLLRPKSEPVEVDLTVRWACYYRIFPTLLQQRGHQHQVSGLISIDAIVSSEAPSRDGYGEDSGNITQQEDQARLEDNESEDLIAETESLEAANSARDRRHARTQQDSLFIRFRKISCEVVGRLVIHRDQQANWLVDTTGLQAALDQEVERARQVALNDPEHVMTVGAPDAKIRVPETALDSDEAYRGFIQSLTVEVTPEWGWEVRGGIWAPESTDPDERVLTIEFINTSPMPESPNPNVEAFLFDTEAEFNFTGQEAQPFVLDLAPRDFRYDRHVWGRGINCAVERKDGESSNYIFVTTHIPVYNQMRFVTRTDPPARFVDLAQDPMPTLKAILEAMENYQQIWIQERQQHVMGNPSWEAEYGAEYDQDNRRYEDEIERFRHGCELINTIPDVRLSFRLTNETFSRGDKTEWRLFQIIFLVSQIPGITALSNPDSPYAADRELVDIIYFPTGGGKTEAYLATIVFHCFFDRLRGKTAGVTAWTRFPLRLLTLQQTQRVADVIGIAELVRLEQGDPRLAGPDVDGFAVGYFVGEGGSPNEIVNPQDRPYATAEEKVTWSKVNDPDARQNWKRVVRCPSCRSTTVSVEFDPVSTQLIHRCSKPDCLFPHGVLPIYIVDNEIYRYLPCVIVGTIDKLAGLGNQRKFSLLFGQVDGRCLQHGYYKGRCCQKDCSDQGRLKRVGPPNGLSGPTLFVQDELHLLKEGLGTFDSHYETFTQQLQREFGQTQPLKIIASSATIEAFERQVNHLYGRSPLQASVFPCPGPTLGHSFYAETLDHPQRLYVGVIPHNKTIFNTILELIELYHREIQALQGLANGSPNPYGGAIGPGSLEWHQLLDFYATSLTYFSSNRELNSIRTDLEGDVNPNIQHDRLMPLEISELTGSTSTDNVSRILERLEREAPPGSSPDTILATSMVSHGVDIDRLNSMIFYGMPRQNSEYIQASSRVGRNHVGIVFVCLHPVRERDQSHYACFIKFHEFLGQLYYTT
jgi:hypothetical protein